MSRYDNKLKHAKGSWKQKENKEKKGLQTKSPSQRNMNQTEHYGSSVIL